MSLSPDQRSSGPRITCKPVNTEPNEYSPEERKLLLKLAHEAILTSLEHRELSLNRVSPHFAEPRGALRFWRRARLLSVWLLDQQRLTLDKNDQGGGSLEGRSFR